MTSKIKLLTEKTINQIAAGEVIENPASVVKELVENAIDAQSKNIEVVCIGGGFECIKVQDDGIGMDEDDANLCVMRHATSKLQSIEDLFSIQSMGFRGEALASIAAVSKFHLTTATSGSSKGTKIHIEGGKLLSCSSSAPIQGTLIEIYSLFFNVPARKKFQKSHIASQSEIKKLLIKFALAFPHISFKFVCDHQLSFHTIGGNSFIESLFRNTQQLIGKPFLDNCRIINYESEGIKLSGYIGQPSATKLNRTGQYLFVNKRAVISELVSETIKESYFSAIDSKQHPIFLLHIDLDPETIDVNVHPQKKHIRFSNEEWLKGQIKQAIGQIFGSFSTPFVEKQSLPTGRKSVSIRGPYSKPAPISSFELPTKPDAQTEQCHFPFEMSFLSIHENFGFVTAEEFNSVSSHHRLSSDRGIVIIDLSQLKFFICYQQILESVSKNEQILHSQRLFLPLEFQFEKQTLLKIKEGKKLLDRFGIEIEFPSDTCVEVHSINDWVKEDQLKSFFDEFAFFVESNFNQLIEKQLKDLALIFLKKLSTQKIQEPHAKKLLEKYLSGAYGVYSPFNKPILIHLDKNDFESLFKTYQKSIQVD